MLAFAVGGAEAAKPNTPIVSIPLEPLGFMGVPARMVTTGATMFTVHLVDATHVLFTYNARTLVARHADKAADDEDRNVAALLLELPTGRVMARTEWHLHDRNQYLWPLAHGHFLLRIGTHLTVLDPLRHVHEDDAFKQQPLLETHRRIGYISVSPGADLLIVQTVPVPRPQPKPAGMAAPAAVLAAAAQANPGGGAMPAAADASASEQSGSSGLKRRSLAGEAASQPAPGLATPADAQADAAAGSPPASVQEPAPTPEEEETDRRNPVQIHFFRLLEVADGKKVGVEAQSSGVVYAANLLSLPVTSEGYLDIARERTGAYDFDFKSHTGKRVELAAFESSCAPRPYWVTRSEFLAFGCTVSADRKSLSYFNMQGEEPWISTFSDQFISPVLALAPDAGRFALGRTLVTNGVVDVENLLPTDLSVEEVTVRRISDGQVLLKVQANPIQRAGQNFDLSADGLELALIRDGNLEIYRLPEISGKEREVRRVAETAAPERNEAAILLGSTPVEHRREARAEGVPKGGEVLPRAGEAAAGGSEALAASAVDDAGARGATTPGSAADARGSQAAAAADGTNVVGDVPAERRKPPSLYDADHPKPASPQ